MALNLSGAANVLKINYQGPVRDQISRKTFLVDKVKAAKNVEYHGSQSYIPLSVGYNAGTGPRAEQATLPTAGAQQYDKAIFDQKYLYGTIEVSGPSIAAMRSDKGAFVRALRSEMDGLIKNIGQMQNRMVWHDGSGILSATQTTSNNTKTHTVYSTKHIFKGMILDCMDRTSTGTLGTTEGRVQNTVSSVASATQIVFNTAFTATADVSVFVLNGTGIVGNSTAINANDIWGIEGIVSASNPGDVNDVYFGANQPGTEASTQHFGRIDRDANTFWQSGSILNSGTNRDLTLDLMQQAYDECEIEGDSRPGAILTNHALKRRYAALLVADRRYQGSTKPFEGDGGWMGLSFNDAVVLSDKDAGNTLKPDRLNKMYFIAMSRLERHVMSDWAWMDEDGAVLNRTGKDAYSAIYRAYWNLCCDRPNAHCVLGDLNES